MDTEIIESTTTDLVAAPPVAAQALSVVPTVTADDLVRRLDMIRDAQSKAMVKDVDYGVIPGTGSKPTLLKPGAEKLAVLFQLDVQLANERITGPDDHLTVVSRATVFSATTGARLGYGEGVCSTRERKYAYRTAQHTCPKCGASLRASKRDHGWYCWANTGGCGAQFSEHDPQISGQAVGQVENPDLPDLWNTVTKMAEKRARVDAILAVTGASALFTQDVEDQQPSDPSVETEKSDATPPAARPVSGARPASGKQRGLIHARAKSEGLTNMQVAGCLLDLAGKPPREFADEQTAGQFVDRCLERLPWDQVNPLLERIAEIGAKRRNDLGTDVPADVPAPIMSERTGEEIPF